MIRPLRRAHQRIWLALAVLFPVLYFAGLLARYDSTPRNAGLHWEDSR